jgi:predicted dehydrogenase
MIISVSHAAPFRRTCLFHFYFCFGIIDVMQTSTRRTFLKQSASAGAGLLAAQSFSIARAADSASNKVVLGFMGVNGRGSELARGFSPLAGVEIAYICDVDELALNRGIKALGDKHNPKGVRDFRKILEDKSVDAIVIAAPDHWHGPATILACSAGKHVYVEKPACHNPNEGELMVAAARKFNRQVQLGTQRRSMPGIIEAIEKVRGGEIGRVLFSRGWYNNMRGSIGHGKPAPAPANLDYTLWQGPAPEREYHDNYIHYNWHWFWHWGTGELGNNGIHALDVCRWGLGVDCPIRVTAGGGKYRWDDDQETPDTHVTTYDFGDKSITFELRSWHPRGFEGSGFGNAFYGEKGSIILVGNDYSVYDEKDKLVKKFTGSGSQTPHLQNFLDAVRTDKKLNAEIEEGCKSTLLCHLGNIAWRTNHTLRLDPQSHKIVKDSDAEKLWRREYRRGWEPKV